MRYLGQNVLEEGTKPQKKKKILFIKNATHPHIKKKL